MDDSNFAMVYLRWACFALVAAVALVDLYLLGRYGPDGTISNLLRQWGDRWGMLPYIIAFGMGALFFHLFGPR